MVGRRALVGHGPAHVPGAVPLTYLVGTSLVTHQPADGHATPSDPEVGIWVVRGENGWKLEIEYSWSNIDSLLRD